MFGDYWESFKRAIMPVSHAESVVNEIYSPENRGMAGLPGFSPEPFYDPEQAAAPDVIVQTKRTIGKAVSDVTGGIKKTAIMAAIFLVLLVAVYAFIRSR